ncbi:odorant receptor 43a-like [Schistocerca gregaria]|uniref:odorant receptor 43a-like n=1 Tax=Schistocerca gregaria TaxID=7010 RepID=UPI00211EE2F7|nr:odorant receptor 43a-like [Schistocerca gregaria]
MALALSDLQTLQGPGASILRLLGVWWCQGRRGRFCSTAAASVTLSTFAWLSIFAALKLVKETQQQLEDISLCCFVIVICFGYFSKVAFFIYKGGALRELLQLLSDARGNYGNGKTSQSIRLRNQKLAHRLYIFMQVALLQGLAAWFSTPLLARAFLTSDEDSLESARQLPVPFWFPGNMYLSPTYEILYISQAFCQLVVTQSATCVDAFFIHIMLVVAAELEVLNENITAMQTLRIKLQGTEYQEHNLRIVAKHGEPTAYVASQCTPDEMYLQMVKNIQHHYVILRSVSLLQRIMNVSIFILLFVNMADLCSCIFVSAVVLQRDGNITKALKPLMTIPPILYETFLYCIVGQILTDQSEKLAHSAVNCGWADSDARFKRSLLVFMTVAGRPLEITVGKMCKLSKQMLVQVLNGTYGLLNLLYHFNSTK